MALTALVTAALISGLTASAGATAPAGKGGHRTFDLAVVSGRADMISGDDALVRIGVPQNVAPHQVKVRLDGRDVTGRFRPADDKRTLLGLVDRLALGKNRLEVRANGFGKGRPSAALTLVNHPAAGPVFSGPHIPLFCTASGSPWHLGPVDENCHVAQPQVTYQYRTTAGSFASLPDGPLPTDVATTTTTAGRTVPYVVRIERGTINRAVYEIAVLHRPGDAAPSPWTTNRGWNDRLVYTFGGACGIGYTQANSTGGVLDHTLLSRGYAVASATFNVYAHNCNDVTSAETAMMVKEHVIETLGVPAFTMGWGGSAGTMQQLLISNAYPGILDGVVGHIGYPDERSTTLTGHECRFISQAATAAGLSSTEQTAVGGFGSPNTCVGYQFFDSVDWPTACPNHVPAALRYHPVTNPDGIRCAMADFISNVYGVDPATGAGRPIIPDTVGVQYGLQTLQQGIISPEQFVRLNEGIGGLDVEGNRTPQRTSANVEAIKVAYATGRVNQFDGGLRWTPIIETRGYTDPTGDFHDRFRSWTMRERLLRANGNADNHASITSPAGAAATASQEQALADMDAWLTARTRLAATRPHLDPVALTRLSRPRGVLDSCVTPDGERIVERLTLDPAARCNQLFPYHRNPRVVAGGPTTSVVLKCQLQPLKQSRYGVSFTAGQWQRLRAVFPDGVCDWSKPGVGQVPLARTWIRF
ncbi:hypothetical protein SAMN05443287_102263 [Micromonospora phaseoli]|uniref:DUF6351 domain-containing protein n=1 Tax=Micromonospora phaseoli TaxID=1144548 RepID=A0A1H6UJZ8_9ACTN|nr:DUF6351 family protein [Micromonospora phaseoli]PZV99027.1 hypothetical protein CLV64_104264 [Micromonospora phaseoli]GIJ76219.1 hypothetical protein Xph01_06510 [Micromonospora phaseoli]SEI92016.1 hypothetical protein SAMN05443287_102263 [Micromonospora phaseoli]